MILWIDAQLSPALASWISATFGIQAIAVRDLGLRDATDRDIFLAAKKESATVCTKDSDFVRLVQDLGSPPSIILIHAAILITPTFVRYYRTRCLQR